MENGDGSAKPTSYDGVCSMNVLRQDANEFFSAVVASGMGLWSYDLLTERWTLSDETRAMLGLVAHGGPDTFSLNRILLGNSQSSFRVSRPDTGEDAWIQSVSQPVLNREGHIVRIVGALRDITMVRRSEIENQIKDSKLNAALTVGRMVIWDLDIATGIVTRSANAEDVLGVRCEPIVDFFDRVYPEHRSKVDWETSGNPVPPEGDVRFRYRHPAGRDMWLETSAAKMALQGERGHIIGLTTDVTDRQRAEERLLYAAHHDPLTGLLNRKAWTALVEEMVAEPTQTSHRLIIFDVDRFKALNDGLGHDGGDAVLIAIGERLKAEWLPTAAARLGGDEFAALVPGGGDDREAARAIDVFLGAISRPVEIGGRDVAISISAGVARFPEDGMTAVDLAKNADLALYAAKASGRKRALPFAPALRATFDARVAVLSEFRDAIRAGHVIPFYQPKVSLATGRLVGFKALARWTHPDRGLLTPAAFAPVFEDGDIAFHLGVAMRSAVLGDMQRWLGQGLHTGRVAVNCVGSEFADGDFGAKILREIHSAGVPPTLFEIEVTEGVMMDRDAALVGTAMTVLREAGVAVSLDDFGTGYASLIHLKRFPVDTIKIDRSFVAEVDDGSDAAIVAAIIAMGRSLGISTVAEGVETADQAARLLALGCDQAQGFLFGKPMHAERMPWFIKRAQTREDGATPSIRLKTASALEQ